MYHFIFSLQSELKSTDDRQELSYEEVNPRNTQTSDDDDEDEFSGSPMETNKVRNSNFSSSVKEPKFAAGRGVRRRIEAERKPGLYNIWTSQCFSVLM